MSDRLDRLRWAVAFALLVAFAVPWFLWRDATVVAGMPLWVWWHVGWMAVTAATFWLFADRAWGLGIEDAGRPAGGDATGAAEDVSTAGEGP